MRFYITLIFSILMTGLVMAQSSEPVTFQQTTHVFGDIRQDEGPFLHDFLFINSGADTISISDVKASCGCTTPYWTNTPIAPGDSGRVQAKYSADRLGTFHKTLNVAFTGAQSVTLHIQGKVIPGKRAPEEELQAIIGNLHMKYRSVNMGKVLMLDSATVKEFPLYNSSSQPLRVDSLHAPAHVSVEIPELPAKGGGSMLIGYNGGRKGDLGFHSENITLYTNDSVDAVKSINLYATVAEYFPPMSEEEVKEAPRLKLDSRVHDFDKIEPDSTYTTTFALVNAGQSTLEIRKVAGNCTCISAEISKTTITPGREAEVTVTFDTTDRRGNQQKTVTIYSNDPMGPEQRVVVKGYVN